MFYVLKLFYDFYSVDMNIYWKIISMTHQFCWLIQKQKPAQALKGDTEPLNGEKERKKMNRAVQTELHCFV